MVHGHSCYASVALLRAARLTLRCRQIAAVFLAHRSGGLRYPSIWLHHSSSKFSNRGISSGFWFTLWRYDGGRRDRFCTQHSATERHNIRLTDTRRFATVPRRGSRACSAGVKGLSRKRLEREQLRLMFTMLAIVPGTLYADLQHRLH